MQYVRSVVADVRIVVLPTGLLIKVLQQRIRKLKSNFVWKEIAVENKPVCIGVCSLQRSENFRDTFLSIYSTGGNAYQQL